MIPWLDGSRGGGGGGRDGFDGTLPLLVLDPRWFCGTGRVGFGGLGFGGGIANVNKRLEGAGKYTLDLKMQRTST